MSLALPAVQSPRYSGRIRRYILRETVGPLSVGLAVILAALLLERVLRLLELLSSRGGNLDLLLSMAMNLVPHYLGLALPAAFFFSLFVVVTRLDGGNELEAMTGAGLSLYGFARPLVVLGIGLSLFSVGLFGFLQPYSRYAYRAILHLVTSGEWNGTATEGVFTDVGDGFTLSADTVDETGARLSGVFIRRIQGDLETVITAQHGSLLTNKDRTQLELVLENGTELLLSGNRVRQSIAFPEAKVARTFPVDAPPFRARGGNERELTLAELWQMSRDPARTVLERARFRAEFHQRLVRAAALPFMPFLAISMGIAAKRTRRGVGFFVGGLVLVIFHHLVQLGEALGDMNILNPVLALWTPLALFISFAVWTFYRTNAVPQGNPFNALFAALDQTIGAGSLRFRRRRQETSP